MKGKIKILMVFLMFSVFCVWAEWERTDVFLGKGIWDICASGDKVAVLHRENVRNEKVSIIDLAEDNQVEEVQVGRGFDICASGDKAFVANMEYRRESISIIDFANDNEVTNVDLNDNRILSAPCFVYPFREKVFVAHASAIGYVSIIDLARGNQVRHICTGGDHPAALCVADNKIFVANYGIWNVSIFDLNTNRAIQVRVRERGGSYICDSGNKVVVAYEGGDTVSVINLANNNQVTHVEVGDGSRGLCVSGNKVFVTNSRSNTVSIIDLANNNQVTNVRVGVSPWGICVSGNRVFVANNESNNISVINVADNRVIGTIPVGSAPSLICASAGKVFVANTGDRSISILSDTSNSEDFFLLPKSIPEVTSYPNPFNPECYIPINAKGKRQNVKCKIYNILGQLVRELECSRVQGFNGSRVYWDGRDSAGLAVPAGVYFYEVGEEAVRKMVVLK